MKLIVITPDRTIADEAAIVNRLFENGLSRLHVRKPSFTRDELCDYVNAIAPEYHHHLVINNHFDLFDALKLGGVHLSSFARNDEQVQTLIKDIPAAKISTSFHSWQEIMDNKFPYGYVFISPVFDSVSKPGYMAGIDLAEAMMVKNRLKMNSAYCPQIIGLGGVTTSNITVLHEYGFNGAAMLGNIWQAVDPISELRKAAQAAQSLKDY